MDGQCVAKSLNADLDALQKELRELHEAARMAAAQRRQSQVNDHSEMVIRGK
jgi:hypothetical protein